MTGRRGLADKTSPMGTIPDHGGEVGVTSEAETVHKPFLPGGHGSTRVALTMPTTTN